MYITFALSVLLLLLVSTEANWTAAAGGFPCPSGWQFQWTLLGNHTHWRSAPSPRFHSRSCAIGRSQYVIGGLSVNGTIQIGYPELWRFDTLYRTWTLLDSNVPPGQIYSPFLACNTTHLVVYGGLLGSQPWAAETSLWTADVSQAEVGGPVLWQRSFQGNLSADQILVSNFSALLPPPSAVGQFGFSPGPRLDGGAWLTGSALYLYGGRIRGSTSPAVGDMWGWNLANPAVGWVYLATGQRPSGPGPRSGFGSLQINGKFYMFGGVDSSMVLYSDIWSFDPATNRFNLEAAGLNSSSAGLLAVEQQRSITPVPRQVAITYYANGYVYVAGGMGPFSALLNDLWRFDLSTSSWTLLFQQPDNSLASVGRPFVPHLSHHPGGISSSAGAVFDQAGLPALYLHGGEGLQFFTEVLPAGRNRTITQQGTRRTASSSLWALKCQPVLDCGPVPVVPDPDSVPECSYARWNIAGRNATAIGSQLAGSAPLLVIGSIKVVPSNPLDPTTAFNYSGPVVSATECLNISGSYTFNSGQLQDDSSLPLFEGNASCLDTSTLNEVVVTLKPGQCSSLRRTMQGDRALISAVIAPCPTSHLALYIGLGVVVAVAVISAAVLAFLLITRGRLGRYLLYGVNEAENIGIENSHELSSMSSRVDTGYTRMT